METKKHSFFCFFCSVSGEKAKTPCVFWISVGKPKNTMCFCWDFWWQTKKTLGKPKNLKVWGPSERFWILDFWFCSAFGGNQKCKNPKIQNLSEGLETFGFCGFPSFFLAFQQESKNHMGFWILSGKPKNTRLFLLFVRSLVKKQKNPVCFWISVGKQKHLVFFGFLLENQKAQE